MQQNPDVDFDGVPGYEQLQQRVRAKQMSQQVPNPDIMSPQITMGTEGFTAKPVTKETIAMRVLKQKLSGAPIPKNQEAILDEYFKRDKKKKSQEDLDETDIKKIYDMAKNMAQLDPNVPFNMETQEKEITNDLIDLYMPKATNLLYPNIKEENSVVDRTIKIPTSVKTTSQAKQYLMDLGMSEEQAITEIRNFMSGGQGKEWRR